MRFNSSTLRLISVGIIALVVVIQWFRSGSKGPDLRDPPVFSDPSAQRSHSSQTAPPSSKTSSAQHAKSDAQILEAIRAHATGVLVQSSGKVTKLLPDDRDGNWHQRFIIRLKEGQTLLIAHNIDLAPRVPVEEGRVIEFKGQYEWNEQGGVVHWTHRDPGKRHADGWIKLDGKTFE